MPKIIGQAEQLQAMNNIKTFLKEMETTNKFLGASNPTGEYAISFKDAAGHKISISILAPEKQVIDDLARAYRQRVAEEVVKMAEENRIELDDSEKKLLGIE